MYITTPIYYASGRLHLGHTYTTILADALKKYYENNGVDTFFLTGSDEHGEKIEKKALESNISPKDYVDGIVTDMKGLWELLEIDYDKFIRTSDEKHKEYVQKIFLKMLNNDDIYLGAYEGLYCTSCESYVSRTNEPVCPDCNGPLITLSEECYFFRCQKYQKKLEKFYEENPSFLEPTVRKNEIFNSFINEGVRDLAVSRKNLKWGIDTGTNNGHKIYVWLDALFNYKSAVVDDKLWPADVHIVGKEITRFHAIYWPMFLLAIEEPMPKKIISHGWLLMDEMKMSKSKGNVIFAEPIIKKYGADALRFYLLLEMKNGSDGSFSSMNFLEKYNAMLVNDLSNLISRTHAMTVKFVNGEIKFHGDEKKDDVLINEIKKISFENIKSFDFPEYILNNWKIIKLANKYIDEMKPWILGKKEDKREINSCLYTLWLYIAEINLALIPIIPKTAEKLKNFYCFDDSGNFKLTGIYENLFMRVDVLKEAKLLEEKIIEETMLEKRKVNK